jgi:hypothetical protein
VSTFLSDDMLGFITAMCNAEMLTRDDLLLLLEKPWKWDAEFVVWRANGCPPDLDEVLIELLDAA